MVSVTQRIKSIKQPRGGYLNPSLFVKTELKNLKELYSYENVHPALIGTAVDYLTRFHRNTKRINVIAAKQAFSVSLNGAYLVGESDKAMSLIKGIVDFGDTSIINALKLVGYDVAFRAGPHLFQGIDHINPDDNTIKNVRNLVVRSLEFFQMYGPVVKDGFTFEGGYTNTVNCGDGDFLTEKVLWDFKVLRSEPNKDATLQVLTYYLMGIHSVHKEFQSIKQLGLYNPRFNCVYLLNISDIPKDIISEVEKVVIGYR